MVGMAFRTSLAAAAAAVVVAADTVGTPLPHLASARAYSAESQTERNALSPNGGIPRLGLLIGDQGADLQRQPIVVGPGMQSPM